MADTAATRAAEALSKANQALAQLASHEKYCEERGRRADAFEAETRKTLGDVSDKIDRGMSAITDKIERSNSRIHGRLDGMNKQIIGVLASVVLGGASWLAVYLLERVQ
jgi:hypothetical protein